MVNAEPGWLLDCQITSLSLKRSFLQVRSDLSDLRGDHLPRPNNIPLDVDLESSSIIRSSICTVQVPTGVACKHVGSI